VNPYADSNDFVPLVEGLRDLQRAAGREAEAAVSLALERREIVEARRRLRGRFLFLGDVSERLTLARRQHGFAQRLFPNAVNAVVFVVGDLLEIRALINALVAALRDSELSGDAPESAGLEITNLQLAREDDGERGRLHAADGGDIAGPEPNMRFVRARVPLMPMSQSLSLRQRAASARPAICAASRRFLKAVTIPSVVIVCIHARLKGILLFVS